MNWARYMKVIALISAHHAGNPITAAEIERQLGCKRVDVWRAVREARLAGIPIGSRRAGNGGYFLIKTEAEMERFLSHFLAPAYESLAIARAMTGKFPALRDRYPGLFPHGGSHE